MAPIQLIQHSVRSRCGFPAVRHARIRSVGSRTRRLRECPALGRALARARVSDLLRFRAAVWDTGERVNVAGPVSDAPNDDLGKRDHRYP
jgi:hypothetical protein